MEERRLLLAVSLSLLVLTAYSLLFAPAAPEKGRPAPAAPEAAAGSPSPSLRPTPGPAPSAEATPAPATPAAHPAPPAAAVADEAERRVEVKAETYALAFTNRGAGLISWTLARFHDARGRPEEMVPARGPGLRPLELETGDEELDARLHEALFRASTTALVVRGDAARELRFTFSDGTVEAEKTLAFRTDGLVALTGSVRRNGQLLPSRFVFGPGVGNPSPQEREVQGYQPPQGVALTEGGVTRLAAKKLPPAGETVSGARWVGVESHYFAALFVDPAGTTTATIRPVSVPGPDEKPVLAPVVGVEASPREPVLLYVGAKDYQGLASLGYGLQRVVPVGDWIGPIVVALMGLLRWVNGHIGNWGWSIVLVTVLINLVMAPFRHYSISNGMKMAKLSPEMRVIQERYRKVPLMDPRRQKMQEEVQALYAKHGMSMGSQMMVGCLPLLLTMPFLWAFYRVLTVSVELRGAPFLWIGDLAQKDPLFLTPLLMGVSMFSMQRLTPSTLDPAQQRIMLLMPLMLTGMFLWAPAGLNLYWLTSNLWSIGQQLVEMRILRTGDTPRAARGSRAK